MTRYMVIERFHNGALDAVYQRFAEHGRMLPDGLYYIDSWLSADSNTCFQLMETDNKSLFDEWIEHWRDLTDFEIHTISTKPNESTIS